MATKPSNHSGSEDQGAFGDQDKQQSKGQDATHYDNDSVMHKAGGKKPLETSQKQSSADNENAKIDRKDD